MEQHLTKGSFLYKISREFENTNAPLPLQVTQVIENIFEYVLLKNPVAEIDKIFRDWRIGFCNEKSLFYLNLKTGEEKLIFYEVLASLGLYAVDPSNYLFPQLTCQYQSYLSDLLYKAVMICRQRVDGSTVLLRSDGLNSSVIHIVISGQTHGWASITGFDLFLLREEMIRLAAFDKGWGGFYDGRIIFPSQESIPISIHPKANDCNFQAVTLRNVLGERYSRYQKLQILSGFGEEDGFCVRIVVAFIGEPVWVLPNTRSVLPLLVFGDISAATLILDFTKHWDQMGFKKALLSSEGFTFNGQVKTPCSVAVEVISRHWVADGVLNVKDRKRKQACCKAMDDIVAGVNHREEGVKEVANSVGDILSHATSEEVVKKANELVTEARLKGRNMIESVQERIASLDI